MAWWIAQSQVGLCFDPKLKLIPNLIQNLLLSLHHHLPHLPHPSQFSTSQLEVDSYRAEEEKTWLVGPFEKASVESVFELATEVVAFEAEVVVGAGTENTHDAARGVDAVADADIEVGADVGVDAVAGIYAGVAEYVDVCEAG